MVLQSGRLLPCLFFPGLATPLLTRRGVVQVCVQLTAAPGEDEEEGRETHAAFSVLRGRNAAGGHRKLRASGMTRKRAAIGAMQRATVPHGRQRGITRVAARGYVDCSAGTRTERGVANASAGARRDRLGQYGHELEKLFDCILGQWHHSSAWGGWRGRLAVILHPWRQRALWWRVGQVRHGVRPAAQGESRVCARGYHLEGCGMIRTAHRLCLASPPRTRRRRPNVKTKAPSFGCK